MTFEQATQSQKQTISKLSQDNMINALRNIRKSPGNIILKWQAMLGMTMPVQMEVLKEMVDENGKQLFTPDSEGLAKFQHNLNYLQKSDKTGTLTRQVTKIWDYLMKLTFGMSDEDIRRAPPMSLQQARVIATTVSNATLAESFLSKVEAECNAVSMGTEEEALVAKKIRTMEILLPLHQKILSDHGYRGEFGYVIAQQKLMAFSSDPVIMSSVNESTIVLFRRAGLM